MWSGHEFGTTPHDGTRQMQEMLRLAFESSAPLTYCPRSGRHIRSLADVDRRRTSQAALEISGLPKPEGLQLDHFQVTQAMVDDLLFFTEQQRRPLLLPRGSSS
jgi:hypothetical protein